MTRSTRGQRNGLPRVIRKRIKLRNAVTELWNNGASMAEMSLVLGLSEDKIKAYLKSARAGYHTPTQQADAEEAKRK